MRISRSVLVGVLALGTPAAGQVLTEQKISSTVGWSPGHLESLDYFGWSIAPLGDLDGNGVPDVAIGAMQDADGSTNALTRPGAVWVLFLESDGTVRSHSKLSATEGVDWPLEPALMRAPDQLDAFGSSIANLGDVDGDGVVDIAVGAPGDPGASSNGNRGAVWIFFLRPDGTARDVARIGEGSPGFDASLVDYDRFGESLATLGDLDGDGFTELAVGSPRGFASGDQAVAMPGAVWVVSIRGDGSIAKYHEISAATGGFSGAVTSADDFGMSLAGGKDINGDGVADLLVGAPGTADADGIEGHGAVWLLMLTKSGTVRNEQLLGVAPGTMRSVGVYPSFGRSVAFVGAGAADGSTRIAVGASGLLPFESAFAGATWIFDLDRRGRSLAQGRLGDGLGGFGGDIVGGDRFSAAIAVVGDVNGDGHQDWVLGAPADDDGGTSIISDFGSAWVLFLDGVAGGAR